MRWTKTLIPTLRQTPAEAAVPSHQLMLRAGLIQQVASGAYTYLPLGYRVLRKVMAIIREEMDRAGGIEVFMPALQPVELWERTGRRADYGENLFVVKDRHGRENALGPTHEEVVTELVRSSVHSYRDLPITLYQIQTKFRDEFRPRFGVLRSREFQMKDAYSFDLTPEGLDASYDAMYDAYCRIFERCGLEYVVVEAESGPIGGSASHEFMIPSPTGEDVILSSDKGNYAANVEKCEIGTRPVSRSFAPFSREPQASAADDATAPPTGDLEKIHTPGCPGIEDLCTFFKKRLGTKLKPANMLKTLVFVKTSSFDADEFSQLLTTESSEVESLEAAKREARFAQDEATHASDPSDVDRRALFAHEEYERRLDEVRVEIREALDRLEWVIAVIGGDQEINESKLASAAGGSVNLASDHLAIRAGFHIGYVGPHVLPRLRPVLRRNCKLIVDIDAAKDQFWVTGANEHEYHVRHFHWERDVISGRSFVISRPAPPSTGKVEDREELSDRIIIADIRNAAAGDPSPRNDGGVLRESRGIEVGHVFKLGTKYSEALGLRVLDEKQAERPVIMGCYGIGANRIIAAAIEAAAGHDDAGIIWPLAIAPYHVLITPLRYTPGGEVQRTADRLYGELTEAGVEVLLDDRDERPGVKFNDADLIGIPLRITVGEKGLATGEVELKPRAAKDAEMLAVNAAAARVLDLIDGAATTGMGVLQARRDRRTTGPTP